MSNTKTLEEAVDSRIAHAMRGLHVGMPGRVESYDSATQRADVQPLIQRGYIDESGKRAAEALPVLVNVPVIFQRSGAFTMTFPIAKGDLVELRFQDFSIDEWLREGGLRNPQDDRNHSLSDAVAHPGLYDSPTDQVHATDAVLAGTLRLGSKDATDPVALKSDLAALKVWIDLHTHTIVSGSSAGTTSVPLTNPSPTPVGATKVSAE